jgi:hypothetical protein
MKRKSIFISLLQKKSLISPKINIKKKEFINYLVHLLINSIIT